MFVFIPTSWCSKLDLNIFSFPCKSPIDFHLLSSPPQDAPVQTQVRQALARPRMAHALRPSAGSSQRITGDLRSTKWSTRREERYRILSSHRTGLSSPAEQQDPQTDDSESVEETGKNQDKCLGLCEIQVVDLIHEDEQGEDKSPGKVSVECYCSWMFRDGYCQDFGCISYFTAY